MLYDIMAECFVDFLSFDKTHPNTYDVASLKKKISIGDGHNIMSGVGSFLGFKGFLDDRSWSAQTKGGIMISNSKGKAYTLKDGVFRESTKDSLLNKLINDLGSFQNNQNAE